MKTIKDFTIEKAKADLALVIRDVFKTFKGQPIDEWDENGILYAKHNWSPNKFIEFGFQRYGKDKVVAFLHCEIPKSKLQLMEAKKMCDMVVKMFPQVECFYDDNWQRDFNNGLVYHETTHKVIKKFSSKSATLPIDEQIEMVNGTATPKQYAYKNAQMSVDYDFIYQKL